MAADQGSVTISIMGKEYQIACQPAEEEALRQSARYLNEQMSRIKARGATLGFEKVAIMAALNISHDFLKASQGSDSVEDSERKRAKAIEDKIDAALQKARQMEI